MLKFQSVGTADHIHTDTIAKLHFRERGQKLFEITNKPTRKRIIPLVTETSFAVGGAGVGGGGWQRGEACEMRECP